MLSKMHGKVFSTLYQSGFMQGHPISANPFLVCADIWGILISNNNEMKDYYNWGRRTQNNDAICSWYFINIWWISKSYGVNVKRLRLLCINVRFEN